MKGIILAGGKADDTLIYAFGDLPTGLIPVNGKPLIIYSIQNFVENGINDIYLSIGYKSKILKEVIENYFSSKATLHFVDVDFKAKPGSSLLNILKDIKEGKVLISLADTVLPPASFKEFIECSNTLLCSKENENNRWCSAKINSKNEILEFYEKEDKNGEDILALSGLYILNDISIFKDYHGNSVDICDIEISHLLSYYLTFYQLKAKQTNEWLDFGHIDKYQKSKKRLLEARSFNSLEFDDLYGTITKKSQNKSKFISEISWQLKLPKHLAVLSPRVIDYSLDQNTPFITMEYYSYPTLAEFWLYSSFNVKIFKSIIDRLLTILSAFYNEKRKVSKKNYTNIYINKTNERVELILAKADILAALFLNETIIINDKSYDGWFKIQNTVLKKADYLYSNIDGCLIHGDFCFSNILYDLNSGIIRLLDPRGEWGENENGDFKYDLAKLSHSICGGYEFIIHDLFTIEFNENKIEYKLMTNDKHKEISEYFKQKISIDFDIEKIKLIEGLLFLSMIPYHSNNLKRQVAMFATAIQILNYYK